MNKITSIHLNGKAYQLEEVAYEALRGYLTSAAAQLKDNPDKTEILADLEQAIAEKCGAFLNPGKDVLTATEIDAIIQEMGPVDGPTPEAETKKEKTSQQDVNAPKRLYLIREGAFFAGVCTGLAAYLNLDVAIVRVAFVALTIVTAGAWILVYAALMFFVPYANTTEERAQAHGEVFNAQEVINRAKESYSRLTDNEEWKKWEKGSHAHYAQQAKAKASAARERFESRINRHENRIRRQIQAGSYTGFGTPNPFFGFISIILAVLWIAALLSLIQTGAIFGWMVTAYVPLWIAIALLFITYHAVTGPMRGARYQNGVQYHNWHGVADVLTMVFLTICGWFAYIHVPQVHDLFNYIGQYFQNFYNSIRS
jgi:phage shock protein PspC (stress-responsive transcriptional regulator)